MALDRDQLSGDVFIGLAEQQTPFAVTGDHILHVELGEEERRNLPGERALVFPMTVLRPDSKL